MNRPADATARVTRRAVKDALRERMGREYGLTTAALMFAIADGHLTQAEAEDAQDWLKSMGATIERDRLLTYADGTTWPWWVHIEGDPEAPRGLTVALSDDALVVAYGEGWAETSGEGFSHAECHAAAHRLHDEILRRDAVSRSTGALADEPFHPSDLDEVVPPRGWTALPGRPGWCSRDDEQICKRITAAHADCRDDAEPYVAAATATLVAELDTARDLCRRAVKYAQEDRMRTPGKTRLQRVLDEMARAVPRRDEE